MITKIKNVLKKVTKIEWFILAVAVVALVVGLNNHKEHGKKAQHKVEKAAEVSVEKK